MMDLTLRPFHRFKELPKSVRLRIWTFAAWYPRVVEVHERYSTAFRNGEEKYHTEIRSRTRPPALLQVCAEAKRVASSIFIPMYKDAHSNPSPQVPIWANPHADITYRSISAEPLTLRGPNHKEHVVPLCATRTLAINSKVLNAMNPVLYPRTWHVEHISFLMKVLSCASRGLAVLIFVIGNDEDYAEFEMEDIDQSCHCVCTKRIVAHVNSLRSHLLLYSNPSHHPEIKVMKVKSKSQPTPLFPQFTKLPQELQSMVWNHASNVRRIISIQRDPYCNSRLYPKHTVSHRCQPPVLSACRASRDIALGHLTVIPWTTPKNSAYYNRSLDVILLPKLTQLPFTQFGIEYIGLSAFRIHASEDSRHLHEHLPEVKGVFVVVGECHRSSKITMMPIPDMYRVDEDGVLRFNDQYSHVRDAAEELRLQLEKHANEYNNRQKKLQEEGKPREGPDYSPPDVQVAQIIPVCRIENPYSYEWQQK